MITMSLIVTASPTIAVHEARARAWGIVLPSDVAVRVGDRVVHIPMHGHRADRKALLIGAQWCTQLCIPQAGNVCVSFVQQELRIGPLLALLMPRVGSGDARWGKSTAWCSEVVRAARMLGGIAMCIVPQRVDRTGVDGWTLEGEQWIRKRFPWPDALHNRLPSRALEQSRQMRIFWNKCKSKQTIVWNEAYIDKTTISALLQASPQMRQYTPYTETLRDARVLHTALQRYGTVFVKPSRGSLGKGIIRMRAAAAGTYELALSDGRTTVAHTIGQAYASVKKRSAYIVQQGISLMRVRGCPVDFRVLVQKNADGVWCASSVVARIAKAGAFVTNVAKGGTVHCAQAVIGRHMRAAVCAVALRTAKHVEDGCRMRIAELGIDIAVDTQRRIWVLEVNAKPSKDHMTPQRSIRTSVRHLWAYAQHTWL
jgi:glutathione synthase/RimK-type ligase-like ATP-grasp enzyme